MSDSPLPAEGPSKAARAAWRAVAEDHCRDTSALTSTLSMYTLRLLDALDTERAAGRREYAEELIAALESNDDFLLPTATVWRSFQSFVRALAAKEGA